MDRQTLFHYVRISTGTLCLMTCCSVLSLWVRSYSWNDVIRGVTTDHEFGIISEKGVLCAQRTSFQNKLSPSGLSVRAHEVNSDDLPDIVRGTLGFHFESVGVGRFHVLSISFPHGFFALAFGGLGIALLYRWHPPLTRQTLLAVALIVAVVWGLMMHR